jgi:hypothetical protein
MAKLEVEKVASASARTTEPEASLQIRFMTFSCACANNHAGTVAQLMIAFP